MHFENMDAAIASGDADLLQEKKDESCVRGCYRCLLSYFNQPDHELIDRSSPEVAQFLVDLARGRVSLAAKSTARTVASPWIEAFSAAGIPQFDTMAATYGGQEFEFAWRANLVAATTSELTPEAEADALKNGWVVFELPSAPSEGLPNGFIKNFES
jgi:hypothetical protein